MAGKTDGTTSAPAGRYECPRCGNGITVLVKLSCEPECHKHKTNGIVKMVLKKKGK